MLEIFSLKSWNNTKKTRTFPLPPLQCTIIIIWAPNCKSITMSFSRRTFSARTHELAMAEIDITDVRVVLLEETLQKNQETLRDNQNLREELKSRDEAHNRVLKEVLQELQQLKDNQAAATNRKIGTQKKQKAKIQVPKSCRVSTTPLSYAKLPVNLLLCSTTPEEPRPLIIYRTQWNRAIHWKCVLWVVQRTDFVLLSCLDSQSNLRANIHPVCIHPLIGLKFLLFHDEFQRGRSWWRSRSKVHKIRWNINSDFARAIKANFSARAKI